MLWALCTHSQHRQVEAESHQSHWTRSFPSSTFLWQKYTNISRRQDPKRPEAKQLFIGFPLLFCPSLSFLFMSFAFCSFSHYHFLYFNVKCLDSFAQIVNLMRSSIHKQPWDVKCVCNLFVLRSILLQIRKIWTSMHTLACHDSL